MTLRTTALLIAASALALSACDAKPIKKGEQFWQRKNMSEAVYAQGPKAQQMLNRDIASCVTELRELQGLGVTKNAIPTDIHGRVLDPDEMALADIDSPDRDGHMLSEHGNYMDFETCMDEKGWERISHVPFEVAAKGRENYKRARVDYDPAKHDTQINRRTTTTQTDGDFSGVNQ